jgi:hypothetical protein
MGQRLHRSAFHDGNSQRALLAVFLGDIYSPEGLGMVIPLPEPGDGVDLLVWSVPSDLVHSWGVLALVFRHPPDGKSFAAERVGQEALQGFGLAPSLFLRCLHDSRLKPTHGVIDVLPVNGMPVGHAVEGRTSSICVGGCFPCGDGCRHLLFLLRSFSQVFS